jgi:hypothetical protein
VIDVIHRDDGQCRAGGFFFIAAGRGQDGPELEANSDLANLEAFVAADLTGRLIGSAVTQVPFDLLKVLALDVHWHL